MSDQAPLRVETVGTLAGLAPFADGWDLLVAAMARPAPFLLHAWVTEWWRVLGGSDRLAVVVALRGDRLVGVLPLAIRRRLGVRVAEFIGREDAAPADLLLDPAEPDSTALAMIDELRRQPFDLLDVFGLPAGSRLATALGTEELTVVERIEAPVMLMPDGFEAALVAKRGARRRKDYRRRMRRLLESGDTEFTLARTIDELVPALEEGFRLNGLRWEGRPDRSLFATEKGRAFHRAVLPHLAERNLARILLLRVEGRAVAFQYWLAYGGAMVGTRRAFDPAFAHVSPGLLTMLQALEEGSAEGLTRVEFLGGPEAYKLEFADGFEPLHEGVGLTRTPAGAVAARAALGRIAVRRRIRNSERLHAVYLESLAPLRRLAGRLR